MLTGGDRDLELAAQVGEAGEIEMVHGILEPRDAGVLERAPTAAGLRQRPASR